MELSDWIVEDAIISAREDYEWEEQVDDELKRAGGDIRITVNLKEGVPVGFRAQGAGDTAVYGKMDEAAERKKIESITCGVDMTIYEGVPANATKNVSPQDLYMVRQPIG